MSIGNLRDQGNQSKNFPWQLKMLLGQQCACDQLTAIAGNTDDLEFLLTAILTTLQAGTEFEAKFVLETCPGAPPTTRVLLEVRIWNTDTSTWEPPQYYLPGSNVPVTIAPGCTLEYADPSGVLAMIYNELQTQTGILTDIEADTTSIDVTLTNLFAAYSAGQQACASSLSVTLCTEQGTTLSGILTELQGTLDVNVTNATLAVTQSGAWTVTSNQGTNPWVIGDGGGSITVDGTVAATQSGTWNINNITGTVSLPTGAATETTLSAVNTKLTSVVRTPNLLRATGSGTIAPVVYDFSVANVGAANGTILGGIIKPGETLNFSAGTLNNSYAAASIAYNGTGTELVIIYNS